MNDDQLLIDQALDETNKARHTAELDLRHEMRRDPDNESQQNYDDYLRAYWYFTFETAELLPHSSVPF